MAVLKNVKVLFSNVLAEDDFSNKYQVVVLLTEEQAADAEEAGITVKVKDYEGTAQFRATFGSKFRPRIVGALASRDYDLEGSEIGRGSVVSIQYKFREWTFAKKSGTSQDLVAVQILELEAPNAMEFEDEGDLGGEDASEF